MWSCWQTFLKLLEILLKALFSRSSAFLYISRVGLESVPKAHRNKLELLTDPDMLIMFERGIRGGITRAVRKYASGNNKYMGDQFDPNEDTTYLQYLDANSLYGWAM